MRTFDKVTSITLHRAREPVVFILPEDTDALSCFELGARLRCGCLVLLCFDCRLRQR